MKLAQMKDGRRVIVDDTAKDPCRNVGGQQFFLSPGYVNVLLGGGWQAVRNDSLRRAEYGSPFEVLRYRRN